MLRFNESTAEVFIDGLVAKNDAARVAAFLDRDQVLPRSGERFEYEDVDGTVYVLQVTAYYPRWREPRGPRRRCVVRLCAIAELWVVDPFPEHPTLPFRAAAGDREEAA